MEETVCKIRSIFPEKLAQYSDSKIAEVYSMYCEQGHGAGWIETDLYRFGEWALSGVLENWK